MKARQIVSALVCFEREAAAAQSETVPAHPTAYFSNNFVEDVSVESGPHFAGRRHYTNAQRSERGSRRRVPQVAALRRDCFDIRVVLLPRFNIHLRQCAC